MAATQQVAPFVKSLDHRYMCCSLIKESGLYFVDLCQILNLFVSVHLGNMEENYQA